jgi:hypothetical protein
VTHPSEASLTVQEQSEKTGFEKKRKDTLHRERLANHTASASGKDGPICAELEFQRDAGDHADGEIDGKNARPET